MAAKHAGIKEFTGDETANLFLGQGGFHVLGDASSAEYHTIDATETINSQSHTGKTDGIYWCAIKAVDGAATVKARSYNTSDDLSLTGLYAGGTLELADGDIVYGAFDAITIGAGDYVIAYIGK